MGGKDALDTPTRPRPAPTTELSLSSKGSVMPRELPPRQGLDQQSPQRAAPCQGLDRRSSHRAAPCQGLDRRSPQRAAPCQGLDQHSPAFLAHRDQNCGKASLHRPALGDGLGVIPAHDAYHALCFYYHTSPSSHLQALDPRGGDPWSRQSLQLCWDSRPARISRVATEVHGEGKGARRPRLTFWRCPWD